MGNEELHEIGICCWRHRDCGEAFKFRASRRDAQADWKMQDAAGKAGWVIGHHDGQGHYAGPNCASTLFDPVPLSGPLITDRPRILAMLKKSRRTKRK